MSSFPYPDFGRRSVVGQLEKLWIEGHAGKEDLVLLLGALTERGLKSDHEPFKAAKRCLFLNMDEIADFRAAATFVTTYRESLSASEVEEVKKRFEPFAEKYSEGWDDTDPDWLRQVAGDLEFVSEKLEVNVDRLTAPLYQKADEIENERSARGYDEESEHGWQPSAFYADDIDQMFLSLKAELDT